jgi:hypothetical protein
MSGLSTPTRSAGLDGVVTGEETDEQMEAMRSANAARRESERLDSERLESARRHSRRPERVRKSPPVPEIGRGLRRSPERMKEDTFPYVEEDDLPETPEALRQQLEVEDTPPRGILFSSPSKRQKRRRSRFKEPLIASDEVMAVSNKEERLQSSQPSQQKPAPKDPELVAKVEEKAKLQRELESLQGNVKRYDQILQDLDSLDEDENLTDIENLM